MNEHLICLKEGEWGKLFKSIIFAISIMIFGAFTVNAMNSSLLVGSRNSYIYHLDTCEAAKRIRPGNLIIFPSPEKAKAVGYRPCKICNPPEATTKVKEA